MMNQEFSTKAGVKVRAMEAESSGGLIEIDLRAIKQTADGTYLIPSSDLQAAGKWAFTIDVAQMKKEGKPIPPELEKDTDKNVMFLNEIMSHIPKVVKSITDVKNARVHPVERGIEKALTDSVAELTREILDEDVELKESIKASIEDYLDKAFGGPGDEQQEG